MPILTRRQLVLLLLLTLVWGINWPIMKLGVADYPPLSFRAISIWLGVPVLGLALVVMKVPFAVPRTKYGELLVLALANMFVWHTLIILAVKMLSSGRAAILGYSMPIFSAVLGAALFGDGLSRRAWVGILAAATGVCLLLWHEFIGLSGKPLGVLLALGAAAAWALGTQLLRRTKIGIPTLAISFWMTLMSAVVLSLLGLVFERDQWKAPSTITWQAIWFNAVMIFGFAHAAWFYLARNLPPVASTLSVMMIPVLGVFSGASLLGEVLHWQDWAAVLLMMTAIASVLWPARQTQAGAPT